LIERNDVLARVVALVERYVPKRLSHVTVTESADLSRDLGINSASVVDIVMTLEEAFSFQPADVYAFKTVRDLVDYVLLRCDAEG
jgi:acyl carrier protein